MILIVNTQWDLLLFFQGHGSVFVIFRFTVLKIFFPLGPVYSEIIRSLGNHRSYLWLFTILFVKNSELVLFKARSLVKIVDLELYFFSNSPKSRERGTVSSLIPSQQQPACLSDRGETHSTGKPELPQYRQFRQWQHQWNWKWRRWGERSGQYGGAALRCGNSPGRE